MRACIISIGTELTTGQRIDTNSAWISDQLTRHGVEVAEHRTAGDDGPLLTQVFAESIERYPLVIATGGLGPTADDVTRACLASALGVELQECREALGEIEAFFRARSIRMAESNRTQALIPAGCGRITNPRGTAPGIRFRSNSCQFFAFPGVPVELRAMFGVVLEALPYSSAGGARAVLHTFGATESRVGEALRDLMARDRNPLVGTTASEAVISVRIVGRPGSAGGEGPTSAASLVAADVAEVRRRLGDLVFGDEEETLQDVVVRLLLSRGLRVATAESCTGGMLAGRLTDVPGASGCFPEGVVAYANEAKIEKLGVSTEVIAAHGAVSEQVARLMAEGIRRDTGVDYGVSVTGVAGPAGGSAAKPIGTVFIGLCGPDGAEVRSLSLGEHLSRWEVRDRSCKHALNRLRLALITGVGS